MDLFELFVSGNKVNNDDDDDVDEYVIYCSFACALKLKLNLFQMILI